MEKIDTNLYSRQILTFGIDTMKKIINLKILIIGLRGLGIEIAKNIILAGPNEVSISDKNICSVNDLGSNFYIEENDINIMSREDSCYNKLKSLNPYVNVTKHKGIYKEDIKRFNLIIITEIMKLEELYEINDICRNNNIYFIYTLNLGLTGFLFNDFGDNHSIIDFNGEPNLTYNIFNIEEKENNYEIFLDIQNDEIFQLIKGEYIIFKNVKGLEFLNDGEPREILKTNKLSLEIKKQNKINSKYISGGIIQEFKMPLNKQFKSLKNNFINPNNNYINIDASKKKCNILLHCAFVGLHFYYTINNKLPELNNLEQANEIVELSHNYYLIVKKKNFNYLKLKKNKIIEFDKDYLIKVFRWSKCEINPICSFLGGIASQEALKITGKYTPIYQWLRFDFFETIENIPANVNRNLLNNKYDDQIAIYGQEIQEKIKNLNIFMIGAGALGCEYIKNFALMGVSCNKGKITITDNDTITLSNLNRQFLFHKSDIKGNNSKSYCAKREALRINKDMNIINYQLLINENTRDIFNDEFIEKQNILISAVDNISARKFIDNICTFFNKIFLDSGTEGTKANNDIFYPNKSICLNDLELNIKNEIPMCTLKNFPERIEHCIEFSKIIFSELFEHYIFDIKLAVEDEKKFFNILYETNDVSQLYLELEILKKIFFIINKPSQYSILHFANFIFVYYFEFNIKKLIKEQKNIFNNTDKKITPLKVNLDDENTFLFFKSFYYIFSNIINFNHKLNIKEIKTSLEKENIIINESNLNKEKLINDFKEEIMNKIKNNVNDVQEKIKLTKKEIFEKDNDENYHINFILSFSNLRANNYDIEHCDFLKAKEIAGNIIPAIATTTAAITGLCCLQIYTLLQTDNLNYFRNSSFNLAKNEYDLFKPEEKRYIKDAPKTQNSLEKKVIPREYTIWDKLDIYGPNLTMKSFIDYFKNTYNVDVEYINYNNDVLSSPEYGDEDYNKTIEELIKEKYKTDLNKNIKYIKLEITGSLGNADINTPTIRYIIK